MVASKPAQQSDIVLAQAGDPLAITRVWLSAWPVARKVANNYCRRYAWIDPDDLCSQILLHLPRIMARFDPTNAAGNSWEKYLFHRFNYSAKDCLRAEDPLGISWPQKREYPKWSRLGDESLNGFDIIDTSQDAVELPADLQENMRCVIEVLAPEKFSEETGMRLKKKGKTKREKRTKTRVRFRKGLSLKSYLHRKRTMIPVGQLSKSDALQQQAVRETVEPTTPADPATPPKRKSGWSEERKAAHREATRRASAKRKAKASESANQPAQANPAEVIILASKFVDSVGGIAKAVALLEQLAGLRK